MIVFCSKDMEKSCPNFHIPFCAVLRFEPWIWKSPARTFISLLCCVAFCTLYYRTRPKEPDNDAISKTAPRQVRRGVEPERDRENSCTGILKSKRQRMPGSAIRRQLHERDEHRAVSANNSLLSVLKTQSTFDCRWSFVLTCV